jgi:hypothetical protein
MALSDNLVSYWKLDEASGNALDAHGSNELTDNNTVGTATGKINDGRDFEETNSEFFSRASNSDLQTGNIDFTFQAWIKYESISGTQQIIAKDVDTSREYELFLTAAAEPRCSVFVGGADTTVAWGASLSSATWYCLHAWHDSVNNQIGIVVNAGTPVTASTSAGVDTGAAAFHIGSRAYPGFENYFDGVIDEVGFWKRVLSSQDRTDLYNSGNGLSYASFADDDTEALNGQAITGAQTTPAVGTSVPL